MNTQTISVDFPSDLLLALNESENELVQDIKIALAIRLYSQHKLTIGKAAQVAGVSRFEFETLLADHKVPISDLTFEEVLSDSQKLR
jgi:predicted HTH domain antitoxin